MNRRVFPGGVLALAAGLAACATTAVSPIRQPDTTACASAVASAEMAISGPVPQDPNPQGVTVARVETPLGGVREGVPTPEPAQPTERASLLAGPTPQVPIPVSGVRGGPVPQDPNPHGVTARRSGQAAEGQPTPEPATRTIHRVGPVPPVEVSPDVRFAGPVPQDPNPREFMGPPAEGGVAYREPVVRSEPAPREPRPAPREAPPTRGRGGF